MIGIHNAENWLGMDGDSEMSLFKPKLDLEDRVLGSTEKEDSPLSSSGLSEEDQQPQPEQKVHAKLAHSKLLLALQGILIVQLPQTD